MATVQEGSTSDRPERRLHDGSGPLLYWFEAACVLGAGLLIVIHLLRFVVRPIDFSFLTICVVILAWAAADFVTGVVHWAADTWGAESTPFWGPRFLRPFRVHHVTPASFLECHFFDTNGDTAMLCIPGLLAAFLIPLDSIVFANLAVFVVVFLTVAAPTNQIHQWSHMRSPPRWVRWLQRLRLILPPEEHARHHRHPHVKSYCISSGVCNSCLDRVDFFPRLERVITKLTGLRPREDEELHRGSFEVKKSDGPETAQDRAKALATGGPKVGEGDG